MTWKVPVTERERNRIMRLSRRQSAAVIAEMVGRPAKTVENIIDREMRRRLEGHPCFRANERCSPLAVRFREGAHVYCVRHAAEAAAIESGRNI